MFHSERGAFEPRADAAQAGDFITLGSAGPKGFRRGVLALGVEVAGHVAVASGRFGVLLAQGLAQDFIAIEWLGLGIVALAVEVEGHVDVALGRGGVVMAREPGRDLEALW